jgi:segregation and condensation protein B
VAVGSGIIKSLLERDWVHVVGFKEVPGKPALYATTKQFLDYFSLTDLDNLPDLPTQQTNKIDQLLSDPSVRELSE